MEANRTILKLATFLGACVLFLIISSSAWASVSPVIFYSDLTSGPNTGGQNSNGVFVTIWGNNFGTSQSSSTVKVGGGAVNNYQTWTNTEICFQLGSFTSTGNIVVTTSGGTSNGIPFTVRSGNIYFVQPGASSNGSGTYSSPFNHLWYAYNIERPGDTIYVLAGTIHDEIDGYAGSGWHSLICTATSGTQAAPIAYVAYPNAKVILEVDGGTAMWTDGSSGGSDQLLYIFRSDGGAWQTISKFTMEATGTSSVNAVIDSTGSDGWRVVGNNITATVYPYGIVMLAGNNSSVLGNEIHNSGSGSFNNEDHSIYWDGGGTNVEIGWNYLHDNFNVGWEISCFHQGSTSEPTRVGKIHDNLITNASGNMVKGILLGDVDSGENEADVEGQNIEVYNNVLYNLGINNYGGAIQAVSGTAYIYNNSIYQNGTETKGTIQFPSGGIGPGGGAPVWHVANNIIYNSTSSSLYLSDGNGNAPNWADFTLLANNNYYGAGNGPSEDQKPVNANPQFVANGTNFQLKATSPDINAGYNTTSIVTQDYGGLVRSSNPSVGAYEYTGSSVLPPSPVVAITGPASGSTYTAGSNVTITTTASETNGTINNVSLYNGSGILLGSSSASPYNYVYSNMLAGGYSFYAVAKDANGVSTTSGTTKITVNASSTIRYGDLVQSGSTIYVVGNTGLIWIPNMTVFNSWCFNMSAVVQANSSEVALPVIGNLAARTANQTTIPGVSDLLVSTCSVTNAPSITTQPVSATVTAPATATFSIAATGTPTPSYKWQQEASGASTYTAISGATSASYTTPSTTTTNSGTKYECVITNTAGSVTSNAVSLTVNASSTIRYGDLVQSGSTIYVVGNQGLIWIPNMTVFNSWCFNMSAVLQANSSELALPVIGNLAARTANQTTIPGVTTLKVAICPVTIAPSITTQPVSATVIAPATAKFSVAVTGTPAPTYQWMQSVNGGSFTKISGATSASYTTAATTTANSGTKYECVITNTAGSVTSNAVGLTVNPAIRYGDLVQSGVNIYMVGNTGLIWIPNMTVFNSWCFNMSAVVQANSSELALPVVSNLAARTANQITIPGVTTLKVAICT